MKRYGFWRPTPGLLPCVKSPAVSARDASTGTPTSPVLTFTAVMPFLILAILEADLHRDDLKALGLFGDAESVWPMFAGP